MPTTPTNLYLPIHRPTPFPKRKRGNSTRRYLLRNTLIKQRIKAFATLVPTALLERCYNATDVEHVSCFVHQIRQSVLSCSIGQQPFIHSELLDAIAGDRYVSQFDRLLDGWCERGQSYHTPTFNSQGKKVTDGQCKAIRCLEPRLFDPNEPSELVSFIAPLSSEAVTEGRQVAVSGLQRVYFDKDAILAQYVAIRDELGIEGFNRWCRIRGIGKGIKPLKQPTKSDRKLLKKVAALFRYRGLLSSLGVDAVTGKHDPTHDARARWSVDSFGERLHWDLTNLPKAARAACYLRDEDEQIRPIKLHDIPCAQLAGLLAVWSAFSHEEASDLYGDEEVLDYVVKNAIRELPDDAPQTLVKLLDAQRRGDDLYFELGRLLGYGDDELTDELRDELKTLTFGMLFSRHHKADEFQPLREQHGFDASTYYRGLLDAASTKEADELKRKERLATRCGDLFRFLVWMADVDLGLTRNGTAIAPGTSLVALTQRLESRVMNTAVLAYEAASAAPVSTLHDALITTDNDEGLADQCLRDALSLIGIVYHSDPANTLEEIRDLPELSPRSGITTNNTNTPKDEEANTMPFDLDSIPMLPKRPPTIEAIDLDGVRVPDGVVRCDPPTNPRFKDLTGNTYGRLTVLSYWGKKSYVRKSGKRAGATRHKHHWVCKCDCGEQRIIGASDLRSGDSSSCGCYNAEASAKRNTTHGYSNHPHFHRVLNILRRCYDPNHHAYHCYGGRGIEVYGPWREDPRLMCDWLSENLGPRPEGYTLNRINNDGNYTPGNLEWASPEEQIRNRRPPEEWRNHKSKSGKITLEAVNVESRFYFTAS